MSIHPKESIVVCTIDSIAFSRWISIDISNTRTPNSLFISEAVSLVLSAFLAAMTISAPASARPQAIPLPMNDQLFPYHTQIPLYCK
jgi:hypothetical protein